MGQEDGKAPECSYFPVSQRNPVFCKLQGCRGWTRPWIPGCVLCRSQSVGCALKALSFQSKGFLLLWLFLKTIGTTGPHGPAALCCGSGCSFPNCPRLFEMALVAPVLPHLHHKPSPSPYFLFSILERSLKGGFPTLCLYCKSLKQQNGACNSQEGKEPRTMSQLFSEGRLCRTRRWSHPCTQNRSIPWEG